MSLFLRQLEQARARLMVVVPLSFPAAGALSLAGGKFETNRNELKASRDVRMIDIKPHIRLIGTSHVFQK